MTNRYDTFNEREVERQHDAMLHPPEENIPAARVYCAYCTEEIDLGEDHKLIGNDDRVHEDCWNDYAMRELQAKDVTF